MISAIVLAGTIKIGWDYFQEDNDLNSEDSLNAGVVSHPTKINLSFAKDWGSVIETTYLELPCTYAALEDRCPEPIEGVGDITEVYPDDIAIGQAMLGDSPLTFWAINTSDEILPLEECQVVYAEGMNCNGISEGTSEEELFSSLGAPSRTDYRTRYGNDANGEFVGRQFPTYTYILNDSDYLQFDVTEGVVVDLRAICFGDYLKEYIQGSEDYSYVNGSNIVAALLKERYNVSIDLDNLYPNKQIDFQLNGLNLSAHPTLEELEESGWTIKNNWLGIDGRDSVVLENSAGETVEVYLRQLADGDYEVGSIYIPCEPYFANGLQSHTDVTGTSFSFDELSNYSTVKEIFEYMGCPSNISEDGELDELVIRSNYLVNNDTMSITFFCNLFGDYLKGVCVSFGSFFHN